MDVKHVRHVWHMKDAPVAAVNLALEGHLAIRKDHDFVLDFLSGDEILIWVEDQVAPLGTYILSRQRDGKMWYAECLYVIPDARGKGVSDLMRKKVIEIAKEDGKVQHIEALVAANNTAMNENMFRAGKKPANLHYRWKVR